MYMLHMFILPIALGTAWFNCTCIFPFFSLASPIHGECGKSSTLQWLKECEQLLSSIVKDHPTLYYHLFLVHALKRDWELSRTAWRSFIDK